MRADPEKTRAVAEYVRRGGTPKDATRRCGVPLGTGDVLATMRNRIVGELRGANGVVCDTSGGPPATVEWG